MVEFEAVLSPVADARVLIIDDTEADAHLAQVILRRAGLVDISILSDPLLAESVVSLWDPDLVLLDLHMPKMDGFDVLRMITRLSAGSYRPVIVLTVEDSPDSVNRALALGAHDFLRKPIHPTELALRVRNLLLNRAAYRELRSSRAWLRSRLDLFEPDLAAVNASPQELAVELDRVLAEDSLRVIVQPVVDMRDGSVVGGEALSRFPDGVLVGPAAWFAAALSLDRVMEFETRAFRRAVDLLPGRPANTTLSINLSPETVLSEQLPDLLEGVDLSRIVLELTEHVPVEDYGALTDVLDPLRVKGMRLAVDDTGAGFASLKHILNLSPDIIKLDIGITRGVDLDPSRRAVARMLIGFAAEAGMKVIAEGVETEQARDALLELGAIYGQGYLFGTGE